MNDKSFFSKASFNQKVAFFALGTIMAVVSIYLTNHYFMTKYPTGFEAGSLCNISSFFNCDATSISAFGNLFGVPTAIFGIIIGCFILFSFLHNNEEIEGSLYHVLLLNLVGCVVLFIYSLAILKHLCPMCTVYYIASGIAFFMFKKNSDSKTCSVKYIIAYGCVTAIVAGISFSLISSMEAKHQKRGAQLVTMFKKLNNLGNPTTPSNFRLASATEKFEDAPIRLSIFSDFQCPACKAMTQVLPKIEEKYKGKINIQYFFYPLDHNCNPNMKNPLHPVACQAAYLAACAPVDKFHEIHDKIFNEQGSLSQDWIDTYAKELNVSECMTKPEIKELVINMINQADSFGVQSTPTQLLNGVKIEGVRPVSDYFSIMDDILKNTK